MLSPTFMWSTHQVGGFTGKQDFLVQEVFRVLFLVFKFGLGLHQTETHSYEIACK